MSSWKSYGGINNYENTNNITVDHLSANYFTLKNEYVGYFSICGELSVTNDTYLRSNVLVGGNHVISRDGTINGNSFTKGDVGIRGNLGVGKNVDISGDTLIWGNLHLMQNYEIEGNLMVNGNLIQMGLESRNPKKYNVELHSSGKKLGFNKSTPSFTFDISSDQIDGFSIQSVKTTNKNVIAQNIGGRGIVVITDISNSSVNFFNDNSIQSGVSDGSITYSLGGNIVIKNSNNTLLNSKVSVSNRNIGNHSRHDETVVIYDISSGNYLYDIYENTTFSTGSALTLISDSSYSNTGLNIMTPSGQGIKIVAGAEITNKSRSSGVIGMLDVSNNLVPSLSIISGNSKVINRSSIGINKCLPDVDNNVLDVNGRVKICHSEIVMVSNTKYELKRIILSKTNKLNGFAFGSPVSTLNNSVYTHKQVLLYTQDGGANWNETVFTSSLITIPTVLKTGCTSGDNIGFVAGENGLILFSTNAFKTWTILSYSLPSGTVINITNINIGTETTTPTLYIFHTSNMISTTNKQQIGYFTFANLGNAHLSITHTFSSYIFSFVLNGLPNLFQTNTSIVDPPYVLIAGETGIGRLIKTGNTLSFSSTHGERSKYNSMSQFGNTVIAVGNIISVSYNRGGTWNDFTTNAVLNDVYVNSLTTAITVGNNGAFYSTTDSGVSWNTNDGIINNSGLGNLILNPSRNLSSINVTNDKTFIISSTVVPYSISSNNIPQPAESKIYSCYFPDIFDSINNNVLDVCGNMRLSGDSSVYGNSYVSKTITTNVLKTEFIDYVGSNISIGTLSGGKTIRISDATTATSSNPNNIFIGGRHDNVVIEGTNVSVIGTIATQQATIQLLKGITGGSAGGIGATGTSAGAGINIRDFNENLSAYIHVNQNLDGFVFKSSVIHPNVLNLRVDDLTIKGRLDKITNQQIHNGIVILRDVSDNNSGNVTTMTTAWFDASNVLLCDHRFQGVTPNQQTVTTDFGVSGNVTFYKDLTINSNVLIKDTLTVSNVVVSKNSIMIGTIDLSNNSESSLNVRGGGNFRGNLTLSGNLNMGTGSTIIAGNLYQNSITFLTGNFDAYDLSSGALQINGGVSAKGNLFIGNNLNVTGNTNFKKFVSITNTSDATDYLSGSFIVDGGASIKKNVFILGNLEIKNNLRVKDVTDASGINVASVILSGGCVISKQLYCEGNIITNGNISVYNDAVVGTKNLTTIIPLSTEFTNVSITTGGQSISGGNYVISAGPSLNSSYFNSFNAVTTVDPNQFWSGTEYVTTGFPAPTSITSTKIDGVAVRGNFLQIKLSSRVIITSYILDSVMGREPVSWIVCGSNDGINFISLDIKTDTIFSFPTIFNRKLSGCNKSFTHHRLVVTKMVVNGSGSVLIKKFYLNGFPEKEVDTSIISIGSTSVMGNIVISGSSRVNDETEPTDQVSGAFVVSGGIGISGNAFMKDINLVNGNVTNNLIVNKFVGIGGVLSSSYTLDVSGSTNISGNLRVKGSIDVIGQFTLGNIILTDRTETSQLGQGSLVSFGGASIAGNLFCGGNIVTNNNLTVSGNTTVNGTLQSNIQSNNIVIGNNGSLTIGVGGNFICLGTFNIEQSKITSNIQSNNVSSGALVIFGGAGISKNVNIGGSLNVIGGTFVSTIQCSGNSTTDGIIFGNNTTDCVNIDTGSLQVKGGSSIKGNIYVGGNIIISKQILVRPNINSNAIGEGSLIVVGGASISENCNIGGNTIIYGSTNNIPTIFFPPSVPPTTTLFPIPPIPTTVTTISGNTTVSNQASTTTVSGQTYLNTYQNGTYTITTGSSAYQDYYGYYAIISGYTKPWISGRSYDNITGGPNDVLVSDTVVYSSSGVLQTNTNGEWIQYSLPYILTLSSYSIMLEMDIGLTTLESYPVSWVIAGSNDGSQWSLISRFDNQSITSPQNVRTFTLSNSIGYSHFRFIINKVQITSLAGAGLCATGIRNISFNGIPAISPISTISSQTTSVLNSNVTVNPTTNHITYNTATSSVINTLVGAGTFAGKSSLVVFGDSTVYGTHNVFDDLNIIGNINNPTNSQNINSNVIVNGNLITTGSITGATGSFNNISCSNILTGATGSFNNIRCSNILTGATGSFGNIRCSNILTGSTGSFNNIVFSTILRGPTGSFDNIYCSQILNGATGTFNNIRCSNILTGATGSFDNIRCSNILTGATGSFNNIVFSSVLRGPTGSFDNIYCSQILNGATGTFDYLDIGVMKINVLTGATGSFENIRCSQILNGATGSFENIRCSNILTGATGSFGNIVFSSVLRGATGSFDNIKCFEILNGSTGTFDNLGIGTMKIDVLTGATGSFQSLTGSTGSFQSLTGSTGSFKYLSATTFTSTSDYRIKGNVSTLDHSFNVDKLRPVSYMNNLSKNQDIGLIAHELQEHYPFLVHGEKDGNNNQTVNYIGIVGILINEIKLLKKRVSTLEEK